MFMPQAIRLIALPISSLFTAIILEFVLESWMNKGSCLSSSTMVMGKLFEVTCANPPFIAFRQSR